MGTYIELHGHLDYTAPKCPLCKRQMAVAETPLIKKNH